MDIDPGEDIAGSFERMIRQGFHIEESVFSDKECDSFSHAFSAAGIDESDPAGTRNLMRQDFIARLAMDERLLQITETLYGRPMIPYKAILFEKTGKANWLVAWHQDTALPLEHFERRKGWGVESRKAGVLFARAPASALSRITAVRIHLDSSTEMNGPLRVIPRSHNLGVLSAEAIDDLVNKAKGETCLVGRGGILAMSPLLLHASSKLRSNEPRRVVHVEYAETLDLEPGIRLAIA